MKISGIIIIIIGLLLTIFTAISFFTKEKVLDFGKLEISRDIPHYFNRSPFIGIVIMVVGGFLILRGRKNK